MALIHPPLPLWTLAGVLDAIRMEIFSLEITAIALTLDEI